MNLGKLKTSGPVRLRPPAKREVTPGIYEPIDDTWDIRHVDPKGGSAEFYCARTGTILRLNHDHMHHWMSDPAPSPTDKTLGFLVLSSIEVQIAANNGVRVEPLPVVRRDEGRRLILEKRDLAVGYWRQVAAGPVTVLYSGFDGEAAKFAADITGALAAGGYEVSGTKVLSGSEYPRGLTLAGHRTTANLHFNNIIYGFEKGGYHVDQVLPDPGEEEQVRLRVGPR